MTHWVEKMAPRAVVLAIVGYCVWPSVKVLMSDDESKAPAKVAEIANSLLNPKMPPFPKRDPFEGKATLDFSVPKKLTKTEEDKKGQGGKNAAANAKTDDDSKQIAKSAAPPTPKNPAADFRLEGTCVVGNQRLAVINGELRAQGDSLPSADAKSSRYKITDITPYQVTIQDNDRFFHIKYSDALAKADAPPTAASKTDASPKTSENVKTKTNAFPKKVPIEDLRKYLMGIMGDPMSMMGQ